YEDRFTVAEVGGEDAPREMRLFTAPGRLDTAYGFDFLYAAELSPGVVREALDEWPDTPGCGWPSWAFENHDAPRSVSRWAAPEHREAFARIKLLLLASLRGNIFLYQGEELGLTQVAIPFEQLQDPEAIANWPLTLSRDGARTPMPWKGEAPDLGFGSAQPWLPFGPDHAALAVDRQEADSQSLLAHTRRVLALRRASPALRLGKIAWLEAGSAVLAFERIAPGQRLRCVFNLSAETVAAPSPAGRVAIQVGDVAGDRLGPFAGWIAEAVGS
ncbi:MAG: DUF3459 domain-containing protein, partial [Novosphingobium sp.]